MISINGQRLPLAVERDLKKYEAAFFPDKREPIARRSRANNNRKRDGDRTDLFALESVHDKQEPRNLLLGSHVIRGPA